ncbi:MAG: hypothetical protein IK115_06705 [Lachnospiraceae bacterium]|nr:hypothetical protein [Lachnospiraceae bacterium]
MKAIGKCVKSYWYLFLTGALLLLQALVFLILREDACVYVFDHLDLFAAHYEMMRKEGLWFSHNTTLPILNGISRDLLGSEFELYNLPYVFLPGIWAYLASYALRVAVGFSSFCLLAKDALKENYGKYRPLVVICGCAFAIVPVFPTYSCAFVSLPLIVLLLRRLYYNKPDIKKALLLYTGIFLYPALSYFSYHGIFILAYLCLAILILWIRDRRLPRRLVIAVPVLFLGYVCFEYRLFYEMLFSDTVSIRPGMRVLYLNFRQCLYTAGKEFLNPFAHSQDEHRFLILWLALGMALYTIIKALRSREWKKLFTDPLLLILFFIALNCCIMGFYHFRPLVALVEFLVPKLKGFDFSRASFLNPFLWYGALLFSCMKLWDLGKPLWKAASRLLAVAALLLVMFIPDYNNDFALTVSDRLHRAFTGEPTDYLTYGEYFSVPLFEKIKEDIDYKGEWCVSYAMYPAIMTYNGFSTLDGYLGLYSQEYKDTWLDLIAPSRGGSPFFVDAFIDYGNKVYLPPPGDEEIYDYGRTLPAEELELHIDPPVLRRLDCRYVFSRVRISNAAELGLSEPRIYTDPEGPYTIYLYEL